MIELMEETANMLRGMCMDPRIPQDTKEALWSRVRKLDATTETAIDAQTSPRSLQEIHAVQWYADGGRTRCIEVFNDIGAARRFADHLPNGASGWIISMAVRGEAYTRGFWGLPFEVRRPVGRQPGRVASTEWLWRWWRNKKDMACRS